MQKNFASSNNDVPEFYELIKTQNWPRNQNKTYRIKHQRVNALKSTSCRIYDNNVLFIEKPHKPNTTMNPWICHANTLPLFDSYVKET